MKKFLSILLTFALLLGLTVPAFAIGTGDIELKYGLDVGGAHEVTVNNGDTITVTYTITNLNEDEEDGYAYTETTQDQIVYDHNFFDLVEGSIQVSNGSSVGDYDLRETFEVPTLNIETDDAKTHYIYFNSRTSLTIDPEEVLVVGQFKLKVKDTAEGESWIVSADSKYKAFDAESIPFDSSKEDLLVKIGNTKTAPTVGTAPTASVKFGDTVNSNVITGGIMKDGDSVVGGTWAWKSDVTSYGNATPDGMTKKLTAVFTPENTAKYKSVEVDVNVTVAKADAPTIENQTVSQKYTVTSQQTKTVDTTGMPDDAGTLSYTAGGESTSGDVEVSSWNVNVTTGEVTFTLTNGAVNDTVTLPVTISSTNYADATVDVVITLTDKDVVTLSGAAVENKTYDGNAATVTYPVGKIDDATKVTADAANWMVTYYKTTDGGSTWSPLDSAPADAGEYKAAFDVVDTNPNYTNAEPLEVTFAITKAAVPADVLAKLSAYNEAYDGNAHDAVTGTTDAALSGYTLSYSTTSGTEGFGATMPQVKTVSDPKDVWVKVSDANHESVVKLSATVTKADNALTITAPSGVTYGDTGVVGSVASQTFGAAGDVTYTFSSTENGTYAAWSSSNAAGTWYVKGTIAGTDNYKAVTSDPVSFTVAAKAIGGSVSVDNANPKYGDELSAVITSVTPEAAQSGLTYQWYHGDTAIEGATDSTYTVVSDDIGSTIKVKVSGSDNYSGDLTSDPTAEVAKATQTITAENRTVLIGGELSIVASTDAADDGATLTYAINGSAPEGVSISGNKLTVADTASEGTVTININSAATDNYAAAEQKQITVTISNKADAGVSFTAPESKTYGDADFTIKATVTTAGTNGTWTWTSSDESILQIVEGNTDTVKVKVLKADATGATLTATYSSDTTAGSSTSEAIPVVPKTVSLSWYQESSFTNQYSSAYTYNGSEQGVYAKVTNAVSGDDVTVSTMTGNTATDANASGQSYTATATALGGDDAANYTLTGGSNISKSWKINPRNISGATITLGTALTYTGGEQTQTVTGVALTNPDLTLTTSDYTVSGNTGTEVKTNGSYTLTVTGTGNYTGTATKAWNITKATDNAISGLAITGWTYGSYNAVTNAPGATAKYGTPTYTYYTDDACTTQTTAANSGAAGNGKVPVNAGTYYVKASVAGTANYNEASDFTSFTIGKADYTTSVSGKTVNVFYGKTDATTVTLNDITGTLPTGAAIKAIEVKTDANNIIDASSINGAAFKLDQDPELTSAAVDQTATLNVTISSTNYNDIDVDVTVKLIAKSDETLTVTQQNWTYGQSSVAPGFTAPDGSETPVITYSGTANDGSTYGPSATPPTNAGTYTVTVICETADSIYTGSDDFTINKAQLSGNPTYTAINTSGKTLADAHLTKNDNWPGGEISWDDDVTTSVEQNKAYRWTFIPSDAANYNKVDGTITLWNYNPGPGPSVDYNNVRIGTMDNGKVTATPTVAPKGRTITLTVTPDEGYVLASLTVTDGSNKTVKLTDLGNGKYSFVMPDSDVRVNATFTKKSVVSDCPRDYTCPIDPFTDTVNDAWWHDGIHYCVEKGLMNGVANATFAPNSPLTRGMIVTILWRMEGSPVTNYAMSFKDVKVGQWYTEAIRWAQSTGVVLGYSSEAFGPNDDITREQLAAILYRYANYKGIDVSARSDLAQFNDAGKISGWALDNVKWAVEVGMINGTSTTTIAPTDYTNRAQAAAMIQRFCENTLGR